jgi:hypothetical protein
MDCNEFKRFRKQLNKTQNQMSRLLGVSLKAIHSYEQGWRTIPPAVERHLYFLVAKKNSDVNSRKPCWRVKKCATEKKRQCPAWEFKSGDLCWFINGTICDGDIHQSWHEKMEKCRSCEIFKSIL